MAGWVGGVAGGLPHTARRRIAGKQHTDMHTSPCQQTPPPNAARAAGCPLHLMPHLRHVVHVLTGWAVQARRPAGNQLHVPPTLAALAQHLAAAGQRAEAGLKQCVHALQGEESVGVGVGVGWRAVASGQQGGPRAGESALLATAQCGRRCMLACTAYQQQIKQCHRGYNCWPLAWMCATKKANLALNSLRQWATTASLSASPCKGWMGSKAQQ